MDTGLSTNGFPKCLYEAKNLLRTETWILPLNLKVDNIEHLTFSRLNDWCVPSSREPKLKNKMSDAPPIELLDHVPSFN